MKLVGLSNNNNQEKITLIPLEPACSNKMRITRFTA